MSTQYIKLSEATKEINPEFLKFKLTDEGGYAIKMTNKTGANSIKGTVIDTSDTLDNSFKIEEGDGIDAIGVVYEDGIADGLDCWVVIEGIAEVLLKDGTTSTRNYWVKVSDVAGRADATNAAPPGGTIAALEQHFGEIGHCLESKSSDTNVLCKIILHKN